VRWQSPHAPPSPARSPSVMSEHPANGLAAQPVSTQLPVGRPRGARPTGTPLPIRSRSAQPTGVPVLREVTACRMRSAPAPPGGPAQGLGPALRLGPAPPAAPAPAARTLLPPCGPQATRKRRAPEQQNAAAQEFVFTQKSD